jgi:hypothetical protein
MLLTTYHHKLIHYVTTGVIMLPVGKWNRLQRKEVGIRLKYMPSGSKVVVENNYSSTFRKQSE